MASKVPASLKGIGSYVKIANENCQRDPVIYYWSLFYAVQHAMQLDKSSPEALQFITGLLSTLEAIKKQLAGTDAITSEIVAQAHIENFAFKLFKYADDKQSTGQVDKAVVHAFYTAGHLMDVLSLFGEIAETTAAAKKYAKWKCMQINDCLRNGTTYVPSVQQQQEEDDLNNLAAFAGNTEYNCASDPPQYNAVDPHHNPQPGHPASFEHSYGFSMPSTPANAAEVTPAPRSNLPAPSPPIASSHSAPSVVPTASNSHPSLQQFNEAKKYIKYSLSACDYEDTKTVVDNLRKALNLMGG